MESKPITLHPEQQAFADGLREGGNKMLTGPAGTGKSTLLDWLKQNHNRRISVTASTGIAALNVGGTTLHSWAGLGLGDDEPKKIAHRIAERKGAAWNNIMSAQTLAIDETSMVSAKLLTTLEEVCRRVRRNGKPFGGIQTLMIGDFLQLPPVVRGDDEQHGRFAFNSPVWHKAGVETTVLKTIHRQKDRQFAQMLNECRVGRLSQETIDALEARLCAVDPNPEIKPVRLHSTNASVDAINLAELDKLPGMERVYRATDINYSQYPEPLESLKKNCIAPEVLALKPGAQVMLLKNLDPENGLVNGALGIVRDFGNTDSKYPVVEFANGYVIECDPEKWEWKNENKILASRSQVPLRLAWAITIHKCQGMTLDKVEADLQNVFEYGQAYVALSRAKTLEGLFLTGLDTRKIEADPEALAFYESGGKAPTVAPEEPCHAQDEHDGQHRFF